MSARRFLVERGIFEAFEGMFLVVAVARDLDNAEPLAAVHDCWRDAWHAVTALDLEDARQHPYVAAWRESFGTLGVSMKKFPTSIEAMLKRALKGGEPFAINPLVDFYNALSLRHVCPAGAFDLDALNGAIELRRTREGDRYLALDADQAIDVPAGEIAYASDNVTLTRHFMWRQSREAMITPASRNIFLVSEVPGAAGRDVAEAMRDSMRDGLMAYFAIAAPDMFLMDQRCLEIEW